MAIAPLTKYWIVCDNTFNPNTTNNFIVIKIFKGILILDIYNTGKYVIKITTKDNIRSA